MFALCTSTPVSTCVGFNLRQLTSVAVVQLRLLVPVLGTDMCGSSPWRLYRATWFACLAPCWTSGLLWKGGWGSKSKVPLFPILYHNLCCFLGLIIAQGSFESKPFLQMSVSLSLCNRTLSSSERKELAHFSEISFMKRFGSVSVRSFVPCRALATNDVIATRLY